jgi:Ca-activated chloride channel family protein
MLIVFLVLVLITAPLASSQDLYRSDYTLSVQVEFVALPVSVVNRDGHPVTGLKQENFKVYEDRVLQDIALFKQEDVPVSVGLVIDTSGSMRYKQDSVHAAALRFVEESNSQDETFVVSFSDQPNIQQEFTSDRQMLGLSMDRLVPEGNTALYDAVLFAARHLDDGVHHKKALLIVSDGEDNKSRYQLDEVLEELRESKITIYTVGLMSLDMGLTDMWPLKSKAKKALENLAQVTGGRAFFPKTLSEVDGICRRIALDLRNQYTIGYRPSNDKLDGTWRKVKVQVNPPKHVAKVRVHTKQGYYAPSVRKLSTR